MKYLFKISLFLLLFISTNSIYLSKKQKFNTGLYDYLTFISSNINSTVFTLENKKIMVIVKSNTQLKKLIKMNLYIESITFTKGEYRCTAVLESFKPKILTFEEK